MSLQVVHDEDPLPLDRKDNGDPKRTLGNVMTVLSSDPAWHKVIAYDVFAEAPVLLRKPPQRAQDAVDVKAGAAWAPQDSSRTATWLDETYSLGVASSLVTEAMLAVSQKTIVHPVRAYLDSLPVWDRTARLDGFFSEYCGVQATPYARGVARMLFLSAVARVREPGCKVDTIPVLEGDQGVGKSRLLKTLGGAWFADTPISLGDKDAYQSLRGVWLYEIAELAAFNGRDASRIKSFASSPVDHYRPSYEPRARSVPRQCIFVGTTNEREYLGDATGARRFWPVRIERVDLPAVGRDRDQLWAEADALFKAGAPWWPDASLDALGSDVQAERFEGDPWEAPILQWLDSPTANHALVGGGRDVEHIDITEGLSMSEILTSAIGVPKERQDKRAQNRVAVILRRAGWDRHANPRRLASGERVRLWFRGGARVVPEGGAT